MSYNTEMQENNAELEEILAAVNELPEAGATGDYIPVPATAEVGQTIRVSAVDENGKPTAWEAVDMASGGGAADEYVLVLSKVFEADALNTDEWGGESHLYTTRHFWTTDIDGNALDADGIFFRIFVPAQTAVTSGELKVRTGYYAPGTIHTWDTWDEFSYVGKATFVASGKTMWGKVDFDLRDKTNIGAWAQGQAKNGNFGSNNHFEVIPFEQWCSEEGWTHLYGIKLELVSGSLPAGTQLFIYARKRNPDKMPNIPKWEVAT